MKYKEKENYNFLNLDKIRDNMCKYYLENRS